LMVDYMTESKPLKISLCLLNKYQYLSFKDTILKHWMMF